MSRRSIKVSLALMVTDLLTGKPIQTGLRIRLDSGLPALGKKEGFWVFLNLPPALYTVVVEAPFYQKKEMRLLAGEGFSLVQVGLIPNRHFSFSQPVQWLTGPLPSQRPIWAALEEQTPRFRLTQAFAAGDSALSLYDTGPAFSTLQVWIDGGEGKRGLFQLSPEGMEEGRYRLDRPCPFPMDHRTRILPAAEVDGTSQRYDIPLPASCNALYLVDGDGRLLLSRQRTGDE